MALKISPCHACELALLAGLAAAPSWSMAQPERQMQTVTFGTVVSDFDNQSVWGNGNGVPTQSFSYGFTEVSGGRAGGFTTTCVPYIFWPCGSFLRPRICSDCEDLETGIAVDVERAGILFNIAASAGISGGTFDLNTAYEPVLNVPSSVPPTHFQQITGSMGNVTGTLTGISPQPEVSFDLEVDLPVDVDVEFATLTPSRVSVDAITHDLDTVVPLFDIGAFDIDVLNVEFETPTSDSITIEIPPDGAQSGELCTGLGSVTLHSLNARPITGGFNANEGRFRATGRLPVIDLNMDLDSIAFCARRIRNPGGQLAASGAWGSISYDRIDVDWNPDIAVAQEFAVTPGVEVWLDFGTDVFIQQTDGTVVLVDEVFAPVDRLPLIALRGNTNSVNVTARTRTKESFSNLTALTLGSELSFETDKLRLDAGLGLPSSSLGPLFSRSVSLDQVAAAASGLRINEPAFKLFDQTFDLPEGQWSAPSNFTITAESEYAVFNAQTPQTDYDWTQFNRWENPDGTPFNAFPTLGTNVTLKGSTGTGDKVYLNGDFAAARNIKVDENTSLSVRFSGVLDVGGTVEGRVNVFDGTIEANFDSSFLGFLSVGSDFPNAGALNAATDDGDTTITFGEGSYNEFRDSFVGKLGFDPDSVTIRNNGRLLFSGDATSKLGADVFTNSITGTVESFNHATIVGNRGNNLGVISVDGGSEPETRSITIQNSLLNRDSDLIQGEYMATNGASLILRNAQLGATRVFIDGNSSLFMENDASLRDAVTEITNGSSLNPTEGEIGDLFVDETSTVSTRPLSTFGSRIDFLGTLSLRGELTFNAGPTGVSDLRLDRDDAVIRVNDRALVEMSTNPSFVGPKFDTLNAGIWRIGEGSFQTVTLDLAGVGLVNATDVTLSGSGVTFSWFEPTLQTNLGSLRIEQGKTFRVGEGEFGEPFGFENRGDIVVDGALIRVGNDENELEEFLYDYRQLSGSLTLQNGSTLSAGNFEAGLNDEPTTITMADGGVYVLDDIKLGAGADVRFVLSAESFDFLTDTFTAQNSIVAACSVTVELDPSYTPSLGDEFSLFQNNNLGEDTVTASFTAFSAPALPNNLRFDLNTTDKGVFLTVVEDQFNISDIQFTPLAGTPGSVSAVVTPTPLATQEPPVFIEYRVNDGYRTTTRLTRGVGDNYSAPLPPVACNDTIEYRIYVRQDDGVLEFQPAHGFVSVEVGACPDLCSAADIAAPFGVLDQNDIAEALLLIGADSPSADSDRTEPAQKIDFAVLDSGARVVRILENNGGALTEIGTYPTGFDTKDMVVADFDQDGLDDLAFSSPANDLVGILKGLGDGAFASEASQPTGDRPWGLATADLNGDFFADLVTANRNADAIGVLLNDRDAGFVTGDAFGVGNEPRPVAVGDIDNDGDMDIAAGNLRDNSITVYRNNLIDFSGDESAFTLFRTLNSGHGPFGLAMGDLDGDSRADIASVTPSSNFIYVYFPVNGSSPESSLQVPLAENGSKIAIGDLNNDGFGDLVSIDSRSSGAVSVVLSRGDRTFAPEVRYDIEGGPSDPDIVVSDLNGDGNPDVVVAGPGGTFVLRGNGDGTLATHTRFASAVGRTVVPTKARRPDHIDAFDLIAFLEQFESGCE